MVGTPTVVLAALTTDKDIALGAAKLLPFNVKIPPDTLIDAGVCDVMIGAQKEKVVVAICPPIFKLNKKFAPAVST